MCAFLSNIPTCPSCLTIIFNYYFSCLKSAESKIGLKLLNTVTFLQGKELTNVHYFNFLVFVNTSSRSPSSHEVTSLALSI